MARTVRDASLETRTARARLKASGKPYYRAIDPGLHLGYRRGNAGGKWVMRWYIGDGAYQVATIATADDSGDPDGLVVLDFKQAQALVRERYLACARAAQGLPAKDGPYTIKSCIDEYLALAIPARFATGDDPIYHASPAARALIEELREVDALCERLNGERCDD